MSRLGARAEGPRQSSGESDSTVLYLLIALVVVLGVPAATLFAQSLPGAH